MHILFVTSTRIGDAVLSSGVLAHLLAAHPGARVTIACGRVAAPLFAAVPGLERILIMDKLPWKRHWLDFWLATVGTRWDMVVDLRSSPLTGLLRCRRRWTWLPRRIPPGHRVEQMSHMIGLDTPSSPSLWTSYEHEERARALVPDGAPVLALGPTANWFKKKWPIERFIELARRLTGAGGALAGGRIMVVGAPFERPAAQPLLDALAGGSLIDTMPEPDLLTVFACLKRAALYVGNDSGPMHMAAAAGVPTLGLFGPTDDESYAPWGPHCAVVRTPESQEALLAREDVAPGGTLMDGLTVDTVEDAAKALLARAARAP